MRHIIISLAVAVAALASACGSADSRMSAEDSARAAQDSINAIIAQIRPGMSLADLATLPDVGWEVVKLDGICSPDTLVLYASLHGCAIRTNVFRSADSGWQNMWDDGAAKCAAGESGAPISLSMDNFMPSAVALSVEPYDIKRVRQLVSERVDSADKAMRGVIESIYRDPSGAMSHTTSALRERLKDNDHGKDFNFTPFYSADVTTEVESESLSISAVDVAKGEVTYLIQTRMTDDDGSINTDRARCVATFIPDSTSRFPAFLIDKVRLNGRDY